MAANREVAYSRMLVASKMVNLVKSGCKGSDMSVGGRTRWA